jgi:hypothetical protein
MKKDVASFGVFRRNGWRRSFAVLLDEGRPPVLNISLRGPRGVGGTTLIYAGEEADALAEAIAYLRSLQTKESL